MTKPLFHFAAPIAENFALQARAGRALGLATRFENNCKNLQYFDSGRENPLPTDATEEEKFTITIGVLKKLGRMRLKGHSEEIWKRYASRFPNWIDGALDEGVKSRNFVAHDLGSDISRGLLTDNAEWQANMRQLLEMHVQNIALADLIVAAIFSEEFPGAIRADEGDITSYVERAVSWVMTGNEEGSPPK